MAAESCAFVLTFDEWAAVYQLVANEADQIDDETHPLVRAEKALAVTDKYAA